MALHSFGVKTASGRSDPAMASEGGDTLRFVLVPLAVSVLFAGGVYWMKQTTPLERPASPSRAVVQVQLLSAAARLQPPPVEPQKVVAAITTPPPRPAPPSSQPQPADPAPVAPEITVAPTPAASERPATVAFAAPPNLMLDSITAQFRRALSERLARFKRYPPSARRARAQGTAVVRFIIRRDGGVSAVALTSSAGDAALDREAIATVSRAEPLPRIPAELPDRMALTIPINFSLR